MPSIKKKLPEEYLSILEELKKSMQTPSGLAEELNLPRTIIAGRLAPLVRWGCIEEAVPLLYRITSRGLEVLRTGLKPKLEMRRGKRIVGPRSGLADLIYEPVNELGVIFLFARYHRELGIEYIEGIQQGFPDAFGRRQMGKVGYEPVNIEFEFKSLDFKNHQHDPKGCDIIVCWEHNWPQCPLEVIELKSSLPKVISRAVK